MAIFRRGADPDFLEAVADSRERKADLAAQAATRQFERDTALQAQRGQIQRDLSAAQLGFDKWAEQFRAQNAAEQGALNRRGAMDVARVRVGPDMARNRILEQQGQAEAAYRKADLGLKKEGMALQRQGLQNDRAWREAQVRLESSRQTPLKLQSDLGRGERVTMVPTYSDRSPLAAPATPMSALHMRIQDAIRDKGPGGIQRRAAEERAANILQRLDRLSREMSDKKPSVPADDDPGMFGFKPY